MKNSFLKRILVFITVSSIIAQSFSPYVAILSQRAYAQEVTEQATSTETVTPTQETTTPTPEQEQVVVTETVTPTPAETPTEVTPTPAETPTEVTPTEVNNNSPPAENQGIDSSITPTETPVTLTPTQEGLTTTQENPKDEQLKLIVLDNVSAPSIDLEAVESEGSAVLTTDKPDYAPTDTALITGTNLLPNTTYTLKIWSDNQPPTGVTVQVTSDEDGVFAYAYQLDGIYRPNYSAELIDSSGIVVATVTFTDAGNPSANLDQCANDSASSPDSPCVWQNGNLNSNQAHYVEGFSVPYRVVLSDLPTGSPITITLGYDIKHSGAHALDYLTHFNRLEPHSPFGHSAETIVPTSGVVGISGTITTFSIPTPDTTNTPTAGQPATSFNSLSAGEKLMTLYGGTISNIAYGTNGDLTANQSETTVNVTFTPDSPNAVLAWGGHIAKETDWGAGKSAGGISGSPYHMRLIGWTIGNLGQQDRSLQAGAVAAPSSIRIIKDAQPNDAQDFAFSTTGNGLSSFSLDDDSDNTLSNSTTFSSLLAGSYSVTESLASGWTLSSKNCVTDGTSNTTSTFGQITNGVSINLVAGENVTCTFTNTKDTGTVTVIKDLIPSQDSGTFNLQINGTTYATGGDATNTGAQTINTGSVTVGETGANSTNLLNYTISISCVDAAGAPVNSPTFTLNKNDSITCTITNTRKQGTIELKKVWSGTGGQVTLTIGSTVNGTDVASQTTGANGTGPLTTGQKTVNEGTYYANETGLLATYTPSALSCFNDANNNGTKENNESTVNVGTDNAVFVGSAEHVICTFTNTRNQGTIELKKVWVGTPGSTTLNIGTSAGGSQTDTEPVSGANGTTGQNSVDTGTYYVSETSLPDYTTSLSCTDNGQSVALGNNDSVVVETNHTVICTFTNTRKEGKIELQKDFVGTPENVTIKIGTSQNGSQVDSDVLSADGTDGEHTINTGNYYVSEVLTTPSNYSSALSCYNDTNDNDVVDGGDTSHTVNTSTGQVAVGQNDDVICVFTNTRNTGTIIVKKVMVGGTGSFDFTGDVTGTISTNSGALQEIVNTGTYTSTETVKAGWSLTNISCNDGTSNVPSTVDLNSRTATFNVESNETVICTFTNNKPAAQIDLTPLTATNKIGEDHVITANVQVQNGNGSWGSAPDGTLVTFSITNTNGATATFVNNVNTCITTSGTCFVTINSPTVGHVAVNASSSPVLLGVTLSVSTGTGGDNSADAQKDYVNARISITPNSSTNEVNDDHNFTVTVEQNTGLGWGPVSAGTLANAVVNPSAGIDASDCTNGVNASGQCTVTVNSGIAGVFTITARSTVNIYGVEFKLQTNGQGENSASAQKTYVDASIELTPQRATNDVNDPHTIVAHITKNDGSGVTNAVGVTVTFTVTSGSATFVGNDNDCVTDGNGVCSVQIVDDTPGANTIDATTTFSVGGVSLTRSTDANGNSGPDGSDSAEKTYIGGKIIVEKVTVGGDDSFNFNTNYSTDFQLSNGDSNDSGYLPTGTYNVSEDSLAGWDSDGGVCDNQQSPSSITLGADEIITCTFTNTKRGTVIVTKYDWDTEKKLSDWTIRLDGLVATTSANGIVTFNNLIPGTYVLGEDLKPGWKQRDIYCQQDTSNNENGTIDVYVGSGQTIYCDIWNQNQEPILTIGKTNNATENKSPNDIVTYTLTVTIDEEGGPAENVKVIDLLPKGFTYNSGSWTASSTLHGTLNVPEPTYASPGTWNLVDTTNSNISYIFQPGDIITLRYNATINGSQATGTYYDNAWAQGTGIGDTTVIFASADPDAADGNIGDSTFVGTQVSIINPNQPGVDYKATSTREVLGASTYLPATGENTLWVIIATLLLGLGLGTTLVGVKLRKKYE